MTNISLALESGPISVDSELCNSAKPVLEISTTNMVNPENASYTGINSTSILQPPETTDAYGSLDENDWVSSLKRLRNKNPQKLLFQILTLTQLGKNLKISQH